MTPPSRRAVLLRRGLPVALILVLTVVLAWAWSGSGVDPVAKLPGDLEAVVRIPSIAAAAGPLGRLAGLDLDALRQSHWYGGFGGAAVGVRGGEIVAVLECPRLAGLGPLERAAAGALHIRTGPGDVQELAGKRVYLASRGSWLWIATSAGLLADSLACSGGSTPCPPGTTGFDIIDRGLLARLDRERESGRLNDVERMIDSRLRGAVEPGTTVRGLFTENGLVLRGESRWRLGVREFAKRAAASRPAAPSRLAARTIPGLAIRHGEVFSAPHVWDEIVHDPDNARFVQAFAREIESYEKFLGGRDFERDLLPKLGPERLWAAARVDWNAFHVVPKSAVPALLFAIEARGIEAETLKSIDKFLSEAEREGKSFDLPAPKGRPGPVLDPFRHEKIRLDGVDVWRIVFRDGVSQFGGEFAPGYAVIDGALWVSTFWPLLPKLAAAPPASIPGHAWGELDGAHARALAHDLAGEFAEMGATWEALDRVAPEAAADFTAAYGTDREPTPAYLTAFTALEDDLKRERPDLRGPAFDNELEERLKGWEAGEKRAFAAKRADRIKAEPEFKAEVAARRESLERRFDLLPGLGRVEWTLNRAWDGHNEVDSWEVRLNAAR